MIDYEEYVRQYQTIDAQNNNNDLLIACIEENARQLREIEEAKWGRLTKQEGRRP